ncbi:MAG: DUF4097 family beta strand repeat protein [Bacilli bacterium]|nr:DUF4097 family beta strand repeat protein [Bacilli bacterium]
MSKKLSIVLIVLLSILLALVIGGMILLFNTDLGKLNFNLGPIGIHSGSSTKLIDEKEIATIKDIYVDTDVADIDYKVSETGTIKIELYSDDPGEYSITELEDRVNVVLKQKEEFKVGLNFKFDKIVVYLPQNYANTLYVAGTTADINMDDFATANVKFTVTTGDIDIKAVSTAEIVVTTGDIDIDSAYSVNAVATTGDYDIGTVRFLDIEATTGDIDITETDQLKAKTTTGDYKIGIVNSSLDIETRSGDVYVEKATVLAKSRIKTTTGDVKINRMNDGVYVEGKATTGSVKINNSDRKSEIELKINTTTGDIRVN